MSFEIMTIICNLNCEPYTFKMIQEIGCLLHWLIKSRGSRPMGSFLWGSFPIGSLHGHHESPHYQFVSIFQRLTFRNRQRMRPSLFLFLCFYVSYLNVFALFVVTCVESYSIYVRL